MKVAVTAASGHLGQATIRELVGRLGAENIVAVVRSPGKIDTPGLEVRHGDYQSVPELTNALSGIDTVVMISAPVGDWNRITMHRNVISAAVAAGVRKLLYTSVVGNGKENDTLFLDTQQVNRQAEAELRESGLDWIVARNGLYLEKDLDHILHAAKKSVVCKIAGSGTCGYISIPELAFAIARLATRDDLNGRILNLVGEPLSQAHLVELANRVFEMEVRTEALRDENELARLVEDSMVAGRGEIVAKMLVGCYQALRAGAFEVDSDFEAAAGRPVKSTLKMLEELKNQAPPLSAKKDAPTKSSA